MPPLASRIKGWERCACCATCASGVSRPKLAEQVTEQTYQQTDEAKLIEEFLRRKFRGKQLGVYLSEEKNLAGAFRRLRYAGFSAGQSIRVLKRFASQPEVAEVLDALESEEPLSDENRD